ncbi:MAG: LD-carboxypeptidase [Lachnospiraceae bacterium]|nr:LD-carboxypeptidase [Lachnospiraceae bacterium]
MRFPAFIQPGDTIGFVAPSFGCATEPYRTAFSNALKKFENLGYHTKLGPNCYSDCGIGISNTPEKCAAEWMTMYRDSGTDCLISCGGGELMCEVLSHMDFSELAGARPKWFMGYSDNTNLTFLLTTLADTASLYAPCAASFGMEPWHPAITDAFDLLQGKKREISNYPLWEKESKKDEEHPLEPYHVTEPFCLKAFPDEEETVFQGRLVGGCLDCLSQLAGTRYDRVVEFAKKYEKDGIIWFLEACDLNVMDIRRTLWKLREAGWFRHVRGFLIGRPAHFDEPMMGLNQYEAVTGVLAELNVPILMDLDIGHLAPMMPLVCGASATVQRTGKDVQIRMEMK